MRGPQRHEQKGGLSRSCSTLFSVTDSNDIPLGKRNLTFTKRMEGSSKNTNKKAQWPEFVERALLDIIRKDNTAAGRKRCSFNEARLKSMANELNAATGMDLTGSKVNNKILGWKKKYRVWKKLLLNQSGLGFSAGFDEGSGMFLVDDWNELEKIVPGAKREAKNKTFPYYAELDELFSVETADENIAISSNHMTPRTTTTHNLWDSDDDAQLGNASNEVESPQPKEKSKGKRPAKERRGSASKSNKSHSGVSPNDMQSCIEAFNRSMEAQRIHSVATTPVNPVDIAKALNALRLDSSTYAKACKGLGKDQFMAAIFLVSDEDQQRAIVDEILKG